MEFIKKLEEVNVLKIAQVPSQFIPDDVLERLSGKEQFVDVNTELNEKIYAIANIKELLDDEEDDTNETTKLRIETLYKRLNMFDYLMIINI